jgi:hypothetical protein
VPNWIRIVLVIALAIVLWYLVINLTKSMRGGTPVPNPAVAVPDAPAPAAPAPNQ